MSIERVIRNNLSDQEPTSNIEVRSLTPDDAENYMGHVSDPDNAGRMRKGGLHLQEMYGDVAGLKEHIENEAEGSRNGIWIDDQLVGGIDIVETDEENTKEVSYWIDKNRRGKKLASKALNIIAHEADKTGTILIANVDTGNFSSMGVLDAVGFRERPMTNPREYRFIRHPRSPKQE